MHIKEYIKVFDQCISVENISSILKFASKKCEFHDGLVIGSEKTRKDIRDTQIYDFTLDKKELNAHYDGYQSCPVFTGDGKLMLIEFKYGAQSAETFSEKY